jgi:hypothetical protein
MSDLCLTLLCPPIIEEKLLDLLLMFPSTAIFTSTATAAHGSSIAGMSESEQVLGRLQTTQVQVIVAANEKVALLDIIRSQFVGTGLRYWITSVVEVGEIA